MKPEKANTSRASRHKGHWNIGPREGPRVVTCPQGNTSSLARDVNVFETRRWRTVKTQSWFYLSETEKLVTRDSFRNTLMVRVWHTTRPWMRVSQVLEQLSFLWNENTGYRKKGLCNNPRNICRKKRDRARKKPAVERGQKSGLGLLKPRLKGWVGVCKTPVGVIKTGSVILKPRLKGRVGKKKHRVGGWTDGSINWLKDTKKSVRRLRQRSV